MLLDCHLPGVRPKRVATKAVGSSGGAVVLGLLPGAVGAVVVGANWMETMLTKVGAHVLDFCHLGLPTQVIAAATSVGTTVGIPVLIVGPLCSHGGDGGCELLDLGLHCCQFFLRLYVASIVRCTGCTCARQLLDVLPDLVSTVSYLVADS